MLIRLTKRLILLLWIVRALVPDSAHAEHASERPSRPYEGRDTARWEVAPTLTLITDLFSVGKSEANRIYEELHDPETYEKAGVAYADRLATLNIAERKRLYEKTKLSLADISARHLDRALIMGLHQSAALSLLYDKIDLTEGRITPEVNEFTRPFWQAYTATREQNKRYHEVKKLAASGDSDALGKFLGYDTYLRGRRTLVDRDPFGALAEAAAQGRAASNGNDATVEIQYQGLAPLGDHTSKIVLHLGSPKKPEQAKAALTALMNYLSNETLPGEYVFGFNEKDESDPIHMYAKEGNEPNSPLLVAINGSTIPRGQKLAEVSFAEALPPTSSPSKPPKRGNDETKHKTRVTKAQVAQWLHAKCSHCHGESKPHGDYTYESSQLDSEEGRDQIASALRSGGMPAIAAGAKKQFLEHEGKKILEWIEQTSTNH